MIKFHLCWLPLLLAGMTLSATEAFFAPLDVAMKKSWSVPRDPELISVRDDTMTLRSRVTAGERRLLAAYFLFEPGLNINERILALDLKPAAGVDQVRITLENRPQNKRGSYLVDKKLLSPEAFSTVYLSRDRQQGVRTEPKLELGSDRSELTTLVFNVYGAPESPEIALEVRNPRWVDALPPPSAAAAAPAAPRPANVEPARDYRHTAPFPAGWKPYAPKREIDLADAVIVAAHAKRDHGLGRELQQAFKAHWGKDFPILDEKSALASGKPMILYGKYNANSFLIRFANNGQLFGNDQGYELRVLPDAFDLRRDFFYFGGGTPAQVRAGIDRFFSRFPAPGVIPYFFECDQIVHPLQPEGNELDQLQAHFDKNDRLPCYYALGKHLIPMAIRYRATGTRENGAMLLELLRRYHEFYLKNGERYFFNAFMLFQIYDLMEEFELCTPDDLKNFAEVVRRYSIDGANDPAMEHYRKLVYDTGKQQYLLNSICFRLRSLGMGARYLLNRYDYPPALEWQKWADFMLGGVAEHPFSPEDAIGYQTMTYSIFMNYALSTGLYPIEFFDNPAFRANVNYFKLTYNHQGWNPCYGDAFGLYMVSGIDFLRMAADLLDDEEAEYLLASRWNRDRLESFSNAAESYRDGLPPPGAHTLGLNVQEVNEFKRNYNFPGSPLARPLLDKASFRSGWDPRADYIGVTGMNRGFHGHFDAGGISQFLDGDRVWLHEGHYLERAPMYHNMLSVSRDGFAPVQHYAATPDLADAAAQILAAPQTADRKSSHLSLLLEDYGGADWVRHIGYEPKNGFWVIDAATARSDGEYAFDLRFRLIGDTTRNGNLVSIRQLPSDDPAQSSELILASGDDSTWFLSKRFERGHGDKDGSLAQYQHKTDENISIVTRRHQGRLNAGERKVFVHFIAPRRPGQSEIEVRRLAPNAWTAAAADGMRLAVAGNWRDAGIEVDADILFAGPHGLTASGVRRLNIAGRDYPPDPKGSIALMRADLPKTFDPERWRGRGERVTPSPHPEVAVATVQPDRVLEYPERVGAAAADRDGFAVGLVNGDLVRLAPDGSEGWRVRLPAPVSAVCPVRDRSGRLYLLAGTAADRPTGDSKSFLFAFDEHGKEFWHREFPARDQRHPTIKTIFPARLPPDGEAVFVGLETWLGHALKLHDGAILWDAMLEHGYHTGTAADMTGDGLDEIIPGGPYHYAPIFGSDGSRPTRPDLSRGCRAVAAADLDGDGFSEALFGREDGYLYCYSWGKNRYQQLQWHENIGGPVFGLGILPGNRILAVTLAGNAVILSADRKIRENRYFPAAFSDLTQTASGWAAPSMDGFLYLFGPDGKLTGKMPFDIDEKAVRLPRAKSSEAGTILSSGRKVYLLSPLRAAPDGSAM